MPKFAEHQVKEMNSVISKVENALQSIKSPDILIGARDKTTLKALLAANNIQPVTMSFFECKREFSGEILRQLIDRKGLKQDKFSSNSQRYIYLLVF
jgi:hypothetical protein